MNDREIMLKYYNMLDEKFPEGWKPITSDMYETILLNTNTIKKPFIERLYIESYSVKISRDGGINFVEISNNVPKAYYEDYNVIPNIKKYRKIKVVYNALRGEIFPIGTKGYVLEDTFLILVDPSNKDVTYHDAYVEISYKDFASSDTVNEFEGLMSEL